MASTVKTYTREEALAAIRRWKRTTGKIPTSSDWSGTKNPEYPRYYQVTALFDRDDPKTGGWNTAIRTAGFTPRPSPPPLTGYKFHDTRRAWKSKSEVLNTIIAWKDRQGRWPRFMDWDASVSDGSRPTSKTVAKLFDTNFAKVVEQAKKREAQSAVENQKLVEIPTKPKILPAKDPAQELVTPYANDDPRMKRIEDRLERIEKLMATFPARMGLQLKRATDEIKADIAKKTPAPEPIQVERRGIRDLFRVG